MDVSAQYARFLIGMLIVMAIAGMNFNRPSWARTYTGFLPYNASLFLFVLCQVAIYYALALFALLVAPKLIPSNATLLTFFSPILISVALTILAAQHPLIDKTLREMLHTLAGVPEVATRLTQILVDAPFQADKERIRSAHTLLLRRGLDCTQDWLIPARPSQQLFLKATIVYLQIRQWEEHGQYLSFLAEVQHDFDRIRERFDRLSLKFARTVNQIEGLGDMKRVVTSILLETPGITGQDLQERLDREGVDDKFKKVINDMLLDLQEDVGAFYRAVCRILARWALSCHATPDSRLRGLRRYGYEIADEPHGTYNPLLYAGVLIYVSLSVFFGLLAPDIQTLSKPALVLVITVNQLGALAIAIVPKLYWGFANGGIAKRTPVPFVIGAGLAAIGFFFLVNLIAGLLTLKGWPGVVARMTEATPFAPSAFVTAAATAFLVQDHRWAFEKSPIVRRLYDALFMAFAWITLSVLSMLWLPHPTSHPAPNILVPILFSLALGFALGLLVPGSFREDRSVVPKMIVASNLRLRHLQILRRFLRPSNLAKESSEIANVTKSR